jgi:hypothetical protein
MFHTLKLVVAMLIEHWSKRAAVLACFLWDAVFPFHERNKLVSVTKGTKLLFPKFYTTWMDGVIMAGNVYFLPMKKTDWK